MPSSTRRVPLVLASLLLLGCGAGSAGRAVRPADPTYADAAGAKGAPAVCHEPSASGDPLIVDWKPEDRTDLEVALKKGVAVVHYDCETIKLLPDCTARGSYGYVGVTKKEQLITLADADEAKANLPFSGGSLGGSLSRGSELDIALAMIGKQSTTFGDLARSELKGKCDGATHFVRAATVGAFAMTTGTAGEVKVAADLFGVGASTGSSSKRSVTNRDGDTAACDKADPDATRPPGQCGAALRLQLIAIGGQEGAKKPSAVASGLTCPTGLIATNGKCAAPKDDRQRQCHGGKIDACEAICDGGDIDTCAFYTEALVKQTETEQNPKYAARAVKGLQKACDAGRMGSCALLGNIFWDGIGVPKDVNRGRDLAARACAGGAGTGCSSVGNAFLTGDGAPKDMTKGLRLVSRGCSLGDGNGCILAGQVLSGSRSTADKALATDFFVRACDARQAAGCLNAGVSFERGEGVPANKSDAAMFFNQACRLGDAKGCQRAKGR